MSTPPPRLPGITDTQWAVLQLYRAAHDAIEDGSIDHWHHDPEFKWTWDAPSLEKASDILAEVDSYLMAYPQHGWALRHLDIEADAPIALGERMSHDATLCFLQRLDRIFANEPKAPILTDESDPYEYVEAYRDYAGQ